MRLVDDRQEQRLIGKALRGLPAQRHGRQQPGCGVGNLRLVRPDQSLELLEGCGGAEGGGRLAVLRHLRQSRSGLRLQVSPASVPNQVQQWPSLCPHRIGVRHWWGWWRHGSKLLAGVCGDVGREALLQGLRHFMVDLAVGKAIPAALLELNSVAIQLLLVDPNLQAAHGISNKGIRLNCKLLPGDLGHDVAVQDIQECIPDVAWSGCREVQCCALEIRKRPGGRGQWDIGLCERLDITTKLTDDLHAAEPRPDLPQAIGSRRTVEQLCLRHRAHAQALVDVV
mmetsp:Transcript_42158/g.126090  ORF Transcript_42158/g.126090 Transcript_42158/m.126090 type:complete len:283 (+) Transcript_42158:416-1264(+)